MTLELLKFQTHYLSRQSLRNQHIELNIVQGILFEGSENVDYFTLIYF